MTGLAVIRILLIIALMITAHLIKPFSFDNVTTHLRGTARSFSSVLPESATTSLTHAGYLVAALGVGARENMESIIPAWDSPLLAQYDQASWHMASWQEPKQISKKTSLAKQASGIKRRAHLSKGAMVAARKSAPVTLPVVPSFTEAMIVSLPVMHSFAQSLAIYVVEEMETISATLVSKLNDCEPRPVATFRLATVTQEEGQLRLIAVTKPKAADCKSTPTAIEAFTEEATGPEEAEEAFEQALESYPVATEAVEMQAGESIVKPAEYCPIKP
jgi:hypothetical protein